MFSFFLFSTSLFYLLSFIVSDEHVAPPPTKVARTHLSMSPPARLPMHHSKPLPTYRMLRTGAGTWQLQQMAMFDLTAMLQALHTEAVHSTICLVEEAKLLAAAKSCGAAVPDVTAGARQGAMELTSGSDYGVISLTREMQERNMMVSNWLPAEHDQLRQFCQNWQVFQSHEPSSSIVCDNGRAASTSLSMGRYWQHLLSTSDNKSVRNGESTSTHCPPPPSPLVLVYEVQCQVGLVIRANTAIGLKDDVWCLVYPSELRAKHLKEITEEGHRISIADFMTHFFPQLRMIQTSNNNNNNSNNNIIIKYYPHEIHSTNNDAASTGTIDAKHGPPPLSSLSWYRTIGQCSSPAVEILSR